MPNEWGRSLQKYNGTSLIEMLVCFFILSLLFLGLDALQLTALREAKAAYYFSVAQEQMNSLRERILANDRDLIPSQFTIWNQQNQQLLPQGFGTMEQDSEGIHITLHWGKRKSTECKTNKAGQVGCLFLTIKK